VLKLLERFVENAFLPTLSDIAPFFSAFAVAFGTNGGIEVSWLKGNVVMLVGNEIPWANPNA
jgi:hypothetical protein